MVLRLGGVLTAEPRLGHDLDTIYFEAALPVDGRIQTVDVRDVARAFIAATTAPVVGETLLIGGDDTHRLVQGDLAPSMAAAMDWSAGYPPDGKATRTATPTGSAPTGWTLHGRGSLDFQRISWPQLLAEMAGRMGWRRYPIRLGAPLAHALLKRRSPYHRYPGRYADPWRVIAAKWPDSVKGAHPE